MVKVAVLSVHCASHVGRGIYEGRGLPVKPTRAEEPIAPIAPNYPGIGGDFESVWDQGNGEPVQFAVNDSQTDTVQSDRTLGYCSNQRGVFH